MNQIEGRLEEVAQSDLYLERARAEERLDLTSANSIVSSFERGRSD